MIEKRRARFVLICFCHSVFLGISSPGLIYIYIYNKDIEESAIFYLKDILDYNCEFLDYTIINRKYKVKTSVIEILQIKSSIPVKLKIILKNSSSMTKIHLTSNIIAINNMKTIIEKTTCKDFYWHIINTENHKPASVHKWAEHFPKFHNAESKVWKRIFKLPFKIVCDTKIKTFQFKILHKIIPCNKWLSVIRITNQDTCNYCEGVDDIARFSMMP